MIYKTASGPDHYFLSTNRFFLCSLLISLLLLPVSNAYAAPSSSPSHSSQKLISKEEITPDQKKSSAQQPFPDLLGQEALRLWTEKEKMREFEKAVRLYRDYWTSFQTKYISAYKLWLEMEATQQWLKDPENNPLPPPPPPFILPGRQDLPLSPSMYYPPPWFFGPWYPPPYIIPYPPHGAKTKEE